MVRRFVILVLTDFLEQSGSGLSKPTSSWSPFGLMETFHLSSHGWLRNKRTLVSQVSLPLNLLLWNAEARE